MDAKHLFAAAGCLAAFACAFLGARGALGRLGGQARAVRLQQRVGSFGHVRALQSGVFGFDRLALRFLELPAAATYTKRLRAALDRSGVSCTDHGLLSVLLCSGAIILAACTFLGRPALGALLCLALSMLADTFARHASESRIQSLHDALPDALQAMSSCFGAGFSLMQTFEHIEREGSGPMAELFGHAAAALKTGTAPAEALARIRKEGGVSELSFVAVALAVQHQTGGSMQRVLDATRASVKEEIELRRSLRVHTAQAKLSARVVVGVTIGLLAVMLLLSRDFLDPFFESGVGFAMLVAALGMQLAGVLLVRRLLKVEGV